MKPIIRAEHIKIVYNQGKANEFTALSDVNLEIYPEEYVIFFGPSGCGKSTSLYTIQGLQRPTAGKVFIKDRDISTFSEDEKNSISSQFYGIVFQNFNLIYSLNVLDNVALPQMFLNANMRQRRERALALLKRFGIDTKANLLPSTLSGGQQQRASICRALINDPEVILADEPVGNLDSESAQIVMETLKEINEKDKKTVILVTHDPSYLRFADRVYFFKDGKVDHVEVNSAGQKKSPGEVGASTGALDASGKNMLQQFARVYTTLNAEQLKAWSLANYLTDECTSKQIMRLEVLIEKLLAGKMNQKEFFEELHKPFSEGGVGLYRNTALHYCIHISELLTTLSEYEEYLANQNKAHSSARTHKFINTLCTFILSQFTGKLTATQHAALKKAVQDRLESKLSPDQFSQLLETPLKEGGIGMRTTTGEHISDRMELILAQHSSPRR